jgi:alkaline phosphatase D
MKFQLLSVASLAAVASANWAKNINYRSPSEHHPALGISIHKVVKRNDPKSTYNATALNFTHGVASGDPYPNSVILWTRVAPTSDNDRSNVTVSGNVPLYNHDTAEYVKVSKAPVCVNYKVACDKDLKEVVDTGRIYTSSDIDYTVKVSVHFIILPAVSDFIQVEAKNLQPFTIYYYQFSVCGSDNNSPIGRTKTTPTADDEITKVSLAVYSCSNFPFGFFNAYGNPVRKVRDTSYAENHTLIDYHRILSTMLSTSATTSTSTRTAITVGASQLTVSPCLTRRSTPCTITGKGSQPTVPISIFSLVISSSLGFPFGTITR